MDVTFAAIPVRAEAGEGRLVLADGRLVGVLVRLSEIQGELAGSWFLEAVVGEDLVPTGGDRVFRTLDDAQAWFRAGLRRAAQRCA